ncbi:MAG TPA: ribonuclease P protein component [Asticcacaulis sp.]|nr:ribonuclease P protein component [Asticcacaulis sp.]
MISRIKVRSDFLAASKAPWQARPGVVVQARDRSDSEAMRAGFTATKKVGNAVVRNRAKRRLREAAEAMLPLYGRPGHDYVFVARAGTPTRDWQALLDDVKAALLRLSRPQSPRDTRPGPASAPSKASQEKAAP